MTRKRCWLKYESVSSAEVQTSKSFWEEYRESLCGYIYGCLKEMDWRCHEDYIVTSQEDESGCGQPGACGPAGVHRPGGGASGLAERAVTGRFAGALEMQ